MPKLKIAVVLLFLVALAGVPQPAEAGRWVADGTNCIDGVLWVHYTCERAFLSIACRPGLERWQSTTLACIAPPDSVDPPL